MIREKAVYLGKVPERVIQAMKNRAYEKAAMRITVSGNPPEPDLQEELYLTGFIKYRVDTFVDINHSPIVGLPKFHALYAIYKVAPVSHKVHLATIHRTQPLDGVTRFYENQYNTGFRWSPTSFNIETDALSLNFVKIEQCINNNDDKVDLYLVLEEQNETNE